MRESNDWAKWLLNQPQTLSEPWAGNLTTYTVIVEAIQQDALAHAALLVHSMSRGTKDEARAIAIDEASALLTDEALQTSKTKP